MSEHEPDFAHLTEQERDLVKRIADRDGVTLDQAATRLAKDALARRVKKRTGKTPARVYELPRKGGK